MTIYIAYRDDGANGPIAQDCRLTDGWNMLYRCENESVARRMMKRLLNESSRKNPRLVGVWSEDPHNDYDVVLDCGVEVMVEYSGSHADDIYHRGLYVAEYLLDMDIDGIHISDDGKVATVYAPRSDTSNLELIKREAPDVLGEGQLVVKNEPMPRRKS